MGVFALFRRKSKDEPATEAVTDEAPEAAVGTAEEAPEAPEVTEVGEPAEAREGADAVAEPVEIPKQQSAVQAADNEPAGESARP
ncbi:hypothetical protein ACIRSU_30160 [Streptomyces sp. NPDC101160]|uniref:hypothetical protein n=1 Tax=Streptomyces sp. NPDC101160 TaxID=3366118 RepID=UPI0037F91131